MLESEDDLFKIILCFPCLLLFDLGGSLGISAAILTYIGDGFVSKKGVGL